MSKHSFSKIQIYKNVLKIGTMMHNRSQCWYVILQQKHPKKQNSRLTQSYRFNLSKFCSDFYFFKITMCFQDRFKVIDKKGWFKAIQLRTKLCSQLQLKIVGEKEKKYLVCFPVYMDGCQIFFQSRVKLRTESSGIILRKC